MRTLLSWSSGKDSAWSLHVLRETPGIEVVGLLTTLNGAFDRVAMHGVRRTILEAQARAAGLPLETLDLPWPCPNEAYEAIMAAFVTRAKAAGIEAIAFGDLFLEDIRRYREDRLAGTGLQPLFPLWGKPTRALAQEMIAGGLDTVVTCLDPSKLDRRFAGRRWNRDLVAELPPDVDPCGENGEFHTCVLAGPMFAHAIPATVGEVIERDGFVFADVLPVQPAPAAAT